MNTVQNRLFDLINNNNYDMEDLIESISYAEVYKLVEVWEDRIRSDKE